MQISEPWQSATVVAWQRPFAGLHAPSFWQPIDALQSAREVASQVGDRFWEVAAVNVQRPWIRQESLCLQSALEVSAQPREVSVQ